MNSHVIFFYFLLTPLLSPSAANTSLNLKERFGVSYPEQPVEFARPAARLNPRETRLLGPAGEETVYQQLSTGNILIRTPLPAARVSSAFRLAGIDPRTNTIKIDLNMLKGAYPVSGDVIRFRGETLPVGIEPDSDYFLKQVSTGAYQLSRHRNLTDTVHLTANGDPSLLKPGWIVDPDDPHRCLYAKDHGYKTGDPLRLKSSGMLPAPLEPDRTYFVIRHGADTFGLASTHAAAARGESITLRTLGTGIFETSVEWSWTFVPGRPSITLPQPVRLRDLGGSYEITNGLTGVRVVKPSGNRTPFDLAPVQGVRLADGVWLANGPNHLYESYTRKRPEFLKSYSVSVIESGPLLVKLEARYALDRPEYTYGGGHALIAADPKANTVTLAANMYYWKANTSMQFRANGGTLPCGLAEHKLYWPSSRTYNQSSDQTTFTLAESSGGRTVKLTCGVEGRPAAVETMNLAGQGFFSETISLYAGQKSVLVEDDTDTQLQYFLNLYHPGHFEPNQARYRGHGASDTVCGYSLQGSQRVAYIPYTDALVDLSPSTAKDSSYGCTAGTLKFAPVWYLANSGRDTGWYWQLYNSSGPSTSPLIGYYIGRESRYISPIYAGPGVYTNPGHFASNNQPAIGISMHVGFRGADGRSTQRIRREWALYVSTKSDLRDPAEIQPIGLERNSLAGVNLSRLATYAFEFRDPAGGWSPPYRDRRAYAAFSRRIQQDPRFRNDMNREAPELRDLVQMWSANTPVAIELVVSNLEQFAHNWSNVLVNGNGNFDPWWHYYQPGLVWQPLMARVMAVLTNDIAQPSQKERAKAVAAFAASVFWDDDYVPWDQDTGEGAGNANQGWQYASYRAQNALMLPTQPLMAKAQRRAREYVDSLYTDYLEAESGAPRGSTHYHAAAMDPALTNFLLLKNNGADIASYPRWEGYAHWMLDALTPPEPRFGNVRKMLSLGDGNTEATPMHGMVATLLRAADPLLSAQLQWGWTSQNSAQTKTYGQFSAPSVLVIDDNAPVADPHLKSANYPGYWSVLRHGFKTPNETVAWFVNGDFYSDHRHADSGQVSIYAHSAPLAIDWNANLYYPHVGGAFQHNRIVRESEIGGAWNTDDLPLEGGVNWGAASPTKRTVFDNASTAETAFVAADGTRWIRTLAMIAPDLHYPVIYIHDQFEGVAAQASKVLTWNLMAQGVVSTPAGSYTPIERLNTARSQQPSVLPSNGHICRLSPGLQHFRFTGQTWPAHATQGIDWDLYLSSDQDQHFYIGNWGHSAHSGREMSEYEKTNGSPFHERQDILRVKGIGSFNTIFLPYRKGEGIDRTVSQQTCGVRIIQENSTLCFSRHGYSFADPTRRIITSFDSETVTAGDVMVGGGPTEIVVTKKDATITASGPNGLRSVVLPGKWAEPKGVQHQGSQYTLDYRGDRPVSVTLRH